MGENVCRGWSGLISRLDISITRRPFLASLLGLSCVLSSPPFFFFPALFTFPLVWRFAIEDESLGRGVKKLFWFLFGYFLSIFHWFLAPLMWELQYWPLIPFAGFCSPAILASVATAFQAPFLILARRYKRQELDYLLLSVGWSCFEFFKSHYFLWGLPLQSISMVIGGSLYAIQIAGVLSQSQLDTVISFIAFTPYFWISGNRRWKIYAALATLLVAGSIVYGRNRVKAFIELEESRDYPHHVSNIIGIQGNVSQKLIISGSDSLSDRIKILQTYYNFSLQHTTKNPGSKGIIVWPEGAVLFYDSEKDEPFLKELSGLIPQKGIMMFPSIVATRRGRNDRKKFYNATTAIQADGETIGVYSKRHLVPFGEYIPFRSLIPSFIQKIAGIKNLGDLSFAEKKIDFVWSDNIAIMPTICYDSFFDDIYMDEKGNRPDIIINMTNTGWVGNSVGFWQHFTATRFRAVRNKIPVLNIANNRGSVFINEIGMFVTHLPNKKMDAIRICVFADKERFFYDRSGGKLFKFREC